MKQIEAMTDCLTQSDNDPNDVIKINSERSGDDELDNDDLEEDEIDIEELPVAKIKEDEEEEEIEEEDLDEMVDLEKYNNTTHKDYKIVIDNSKRALDLCSPLRNLPMEKYDSWKEIILQFDVGKDSN